MLKDERSRALGSNFAGQCCSRNLRGLQPDADVSLTSINLREAAKRRCSREHRLEDRASCVCSTPTQLRERATGSTLRHPECTARSSKVTSLMTPVEGCLTRQHSRAHVAEHRTSPVAGELTSNEYPGHASTGSAANVPPLDETRQGAPDARSRKNTAQSDLRHRYKLMDPIGLSLENFDGIGRWRTVDNGAAIDASAQLADGSKIEGPAALRQALLRRPDMFARNVTEMLMTYALGNRVEYSDMPYVRAILKESAKSDYRFSSLVLGIIRSPAFQRRRAES